MTKLQLRVLKQNEATEKEMIGYKLSQKSSTTRQSGYYKFTFADKIKYNKTFK